MTMRAMDDTVTGLALVAKTETFEGRTTPAIPLDLTQSERAELEWFWGGYEAAIGLRSTFREMVEAIGGAGGEPDEECGSGPIPAGRGGGGVASSDAANERMSGLSTSKVLGRARAIYHALKAMPAFNVRVLYLLHGPCRPCAYDRVFGDVFPLVHLTPAVEEARTRMAAAEGDRREEATDAATAGAFEEHHLQLESDFWDAAGEFLQISRAIDILQCDGPPRARDARKLPAMHARVAAWRIVMANAIWEFKQWGAGAPHARVAASRTAKASASIELTPQQAIIWALSYHGPRDKTGKAHPEALKAHLAHKSAFVRQATAQATRMKVAAANAYRMARKAVSP